jgi:MerR family transcriptional regulator/heat shock protein HspR
MRDRKHPVYTISIVSELLHVHPQTLRLYEREGFVAPKRSNRLRLYSEEEVERLGMIIRLTRELGVNKAGVEVILRMRNRLEAMQKEMQEMMNCLESDIRNDFAERMRRILFEE